MGLRSAPGKSGKAAELPMTAIQMFGPKAMRSRPSTPNASARQRSRSPSSILERLRNRRTHFVVQSIGRSNVPNRDDMLPPLTPDEMVWPTVIHADHIIHIDCTPIEHLFQDKQERAKHIGEHTICLARVMSQNSFFFLRPDP